MGGWWKLPEAFALLQALTELCSNHHLLSQLLLCGAWALTCIGDAFLPLGEALCPGVWGPGGLGRREVWGTGVMRL